MEPNEKAEGDDAGIEDEREDGVHKGIGRMWRG
jgi:hypothetical protein